MKVRGNRECQDCGTRWSYYETGSVACPECGSIHSVGVGDRAEHTAGPATLELASVRADVDDRPLGELAEEAAGIAGEYVRAAGFVHAGELKPLPETYLLAAELRRVGQTVGRAMRPDEEMRLYFLSLLRAGPDGQRPPPAEVPEGLRAERGLAVAASVDAYVSDLRRVLDEPGEELAGVLSAARAQRKRIEALDGEVDLRDAERLVEVMRDVYAYLVEGDETALALARDRLA
jgi:uncharacterized Zn finger protein (UPF0148 family)